MWKLIEKRFKEATLHWLSKPGNFQKHADYLTTRVLGGLSDAYDSAEFLEALEAFKSDPHAGVERIFQALKKALEQKFGVETIKGMRILDAHRDGSREMKDLGNGCVKVPSEFDVDKAYKVDLTKLECECKSWKTLSYAGLLCKHIMAAADEFRHKYPIDIEAEEDEKTESFRLGKSPDVQADSDGYFVYGSQKLKKRELTGNPLIPSGIYHVLEGGEPEMVIHALAEGESLMLIGDSGVGKVKADSIPGSRDQYTVDDAMRPC